MKTIIVDDELMARTSLEMFCSKEAQVHLDGVFENAQSALAHIQSSEVDLLFLDIEMPEMNGLELLDVLPYLPQVIFTTGNKSYAYEALEYEVTDFLTKPITSTRFVKSVQKAIKRYEQSNAIAQSSLANEIFIRSDGKIIRVDYKDILYFEYIGDYVKVVTADGHHIFHSTIKSLNEKLTDPRFIKVHRSYIVNIGKIVDIADNNLVIDRKVIPISRAYKPILLKSINLI